MTKTFETLKAALEEKGGLTEEAIKKTIEAHGEMTDEENAWLMAEIHERQQASRVTVTMEQFLEAMRDTGGSSEYDSILKNMNRGLQLTGRTVGGAMKAWSNQGSGVVGGLKGLSGGALKLGYGVFLEWAKGRIIEGGTGMLTRNTAQLHASSLERGQNTSFAQYHGKDRITPGSRTTGVTTVFATRNSDGTVTVYEYSQSGGLRTNTVTPLLN